MELQFKVQVNAEKEQIWPYYTEISKRKIWEENLEKLEFNGKLEFGTVGTMKLKGMPEMTFTLVKVVPNCSFWDRTDIPNVGSVFFRHDIIQEDDKIFIRHAVKLEKDDINDNDLHFLLGVFSNVPESVMTIKRKVEE